MPLTFPPEPPIGQPWPDYARSLYQWVTQDAGLVQGDTRHNVQRPDGTWRLTKAYVDKVHAAGMIVYWVCDGTAQKLPTTTDGLADGDVVNGQAPAAAGSGGTPQTQTVPVTVPAYAVPLAVDRTGTTDDVVRLTRVDQITWVVDGVEYPSADMTWWQRDVPFVKGTATTVTAKPTNPTAYNVTGTSSWPLTFTTGTITADTMITSEAFTRADGPVPAGAYVTDAGMGAPSRLIEVGKDTLSITGGGLKFSGDAGLWIRLTEPAIAIEFVVKALPPTYLPIKVGVVRSNGGAEQVGANISSYGVQLWRVDGWVETPSAQKGCKAGDRVRITYKDGQAWVTVNGVEIDRISKTVTAPVSSCIQGHPQCTGGVIDEIKWIRVA